MNTDIRVKTTFPHHHKTKKLRRKLGGDGICSLVFLWLFTAENRPDGLLDGMDQDDIAIAAQWTGDAKVMLDAMLEVGFLELEAGVYRVHDWVENNPWAANAGKRSEKASAAAKARWERKYAQKPESDAPSNAPSTENDATTSPKQCVRASPSNAPSPSPSPSPIPTIKPLPQNAVNAPPGEVVITKKGRRLSGPKLETFDNFWQAFDFKKGKADAADAWLEIQDMSDSLAEKIIAAAKKEAAQRARVIAQGNTPKWAQGWLSSRRWEDETYQQPATVQRRLEVAL